MRVEHEIAVEPYEMIIMTLNLPINEIHDKYLTGVSTQALGYEYGCDGATIASIFHRNNLSVRKQNDSKRIVLPIGDIIEEYENGLSCISLGKKYNCSGVTIHKYLKENNIILRGPGEANIGTKLSIEHKQHVSAGHQGISYDEWVDFSSYGEYCPAFDDECRESNRDKYGRRCFLSGLPEEENITSTGDQWKLSVHHVDMNKMQGCNGHEWKLVPLSLKYHGKAHSEPWKSRIIWLLNNVWV